MTDPDDKSTATDGIRLVVGILAGGHSKRMGQPKALLPLAGQTTLIEHVAGVAARLRPAPEEIVILGQAIPLPASLATCRILPDPTPDAGPLAGLCSLLDYADNRWGLLMACDMPLLDIPVLARLLEQADTTVDAVVFVCDDRPGTFHSCCALYHPRMYPAAVEELKKGKRSIRQVLARVRTVILQPSQQDLLQLANINTPEDYERLCGRH